MLVQTIIRYLAAHRRVIVPQLGAFLVKEPGRSVVFTELLRQDDGVLRELLAAEGMTPLEAAGAVDRFVFEIRHAVQAGRAYALEGLGTLRPGPNGTIAFVYEPAPAVPETPVSAENPRSEPASAQPKPLPEFPLTPSPKLNPEPCVRGLRYGKPPKTTNAYTYVERPPRRGFDKWLLIALAAAVVALGAIAYGYFHDRAAQQELEIPASDPAPSALLPEEGYDLYPNPEQ